MRNHTNMRWRLVYTAFLCWAITGTAALTHANPVFCGTRLHSVAEASIPDTNIITSILYPPITEREGKGLQIPVPPATHPRLYLTLKDLPALKAKMTSPLLKDCWTTIITAAAFETNGNIPAGSKGRLPLSIRNAIEAKAFLYVLNGDTAMGRNAVTALFNYYASLNIDMTKADVTRDVGRAVVTGAIVYDWCYALLSAAQKEELIGRMETLGTQMEIKWPLLTQGSVTGHGVEAQLSRDMLSCGVATFNEKPAIYNRAAGRILAEFVPVRKFFYPAAYHHQGSAYGGYRFSWDMLATLIFDKLGYPSLFGADQAKAPYYFIYSRRPDGELFRNGDDFNELFTPFGKYWNFASTSNSYAGSYFKDPILLHEAIRQGPLGKDADYLFEFLFCDGDFTAATDKTSLPLTRYFKEPFGAMVARTGWEEGLQSPVAMAEMKVGVYNFVNHQHLDAGSFQIYYKGPLTVESGVYQGTNGGYGSDHFLNYSQRSIAHNTLLVYDPNEKFSWQGRTVVNDGGQRMPNNDAESVNLDDFLKHNYKTGEVLAHAYGPDSLKPAFSYLKGDLSAAYSSKVKSWNRSFVFLSLNDAHAPAALIVFDRVVASNKDFKQSWLLHSVEEPAIKNNQTTITRTGKGYNGKMVTTTLLPEQNNLLIDKIGGADNAFNVAGKNFPQALTNPAGGSFDSATWRIEVSPKKAAAENKFLNVLQVMDNLPGSVPAAPEKIETNQLTGVKIADRLVLFNKNAGLISDAIQLSVKGSGSYKVFIADTEKGQWTIRQTGRNNTRRQLTNTEQVLYFTVNAGNYVISKN